MGIKFEKKNYRIVVMAILLAVSCFVTYYFHRVLGVGTFFTHFFYIPIILASLWWKRRGLVVAVFLAAVLIFSDLVFREIVLTYNDYIRAGMFIFIAFVVVWLSEQIAKREERLQDSEKRLNSFMESATDGFVLFDSKLNFVNINKVGWDMFSFGTENDDVIGKNIIEVMPDIKETGRYDRYMEVIKTSKPFFVDDIVPHPKFGDRHLAVKAFKVGEGLGMIITDITERKRAEEELTRLSRAIKASTDSVVISDINAKIVNVNEAVLKMYGTHDKEDLIGKNTFDLIVPEEQEKALKGMKKVLQKGYIKSREYNIITKDGGRIPVDMSVSTINDKDGKPIGFVGISRDITERKKAEEKIKAALKEKEVMLKEIHHRVKNNMQIMSSLLKLQFARTKSKKLQEMLKTSQNRIHSMALIHERLYQSKDFTRIDFAYYIRSLTVYLFHSYRVDSNLVRLKTDLRDVHIDINRAIPCGLIVNELVSNSLKYAFLGGREGGEGEISIKFYSNKQGKITLVVSDNGVGFPEDIDFRNPESFGMQVVNDLVEQLGGTIELDRKGGTTFKVKF